MGGGGGQANTSVLITNLVKYMNSLCTHLECLIILEMIFPLNFMEKFVYNIPSAGDEFDKSGFSIPWLEGDTFSAIDCGLILNLFHGGVENVLYCCGCNGKVYYIGTFLYCL